MVNVSLFSLPQDVTYWGIASVDVNGDPTFNAGIKVKARFKEKDGIFTDEQGDDHKVEFLVYSETLIPKRSMIVLEDKDGVATPTKGARIVRNAISNKSMSTLKKMIA